MVENNSPTTSLGLVTISALTDFSREGTVIAQAVRMHDCFPLTKVTMEAAWGYYLIFSIVLSLKLETARKGRSWAHDGYDKRHCKIRHPNQRYKQFHVRLLSE